MSSLAFAGRLLASSLETTLRRLRSGPRRPGWSWGFEVVTTTLKKHGAALARRSWTEQRAGWGALAQPLTPEVRDVRREPCEIAGRSAAWFTPPGQPRGTVLYLHGGSFIYGSIDTHAETIARLARRSTARVLAIDYRLAPEHPFPAAIDDALVAYRTLRASGHERIVIAGDSAGGNLAAVTALALRDEGDPPAGVVLLSPWVDLTSHGGSLLTNSAYDWAEPGDFDAWSRCYLGGHDPGDPRASPLRADLAGLPPLFIVVGTAEMLLDQVRAFADKARRASVEVELFEEEGMVHNGISLAPLFERCREVERRAGAFIARRLL
jgi:monoterpene epsilon-lactone hydrolase